MPSSIGLRLLSIIDGGPKNDREQRGKGRYDEPLPPIPPPKPRIPPARRPAELDAWQPGKTREVAHIAELLRQMYELDIKIWASKHLTSEHDLQRIRHLRTESNELFAEIRHIVAEWEDGRAWKNWSDQELAEVTQIRQIVYSFPAKRHDDDWGVTRG